MSQEGQEMVKNNADWGNASQIRVEADGIDLYAQKGHLPHPNSKKGVWR
jgi:hypothetical protein